MTISPTQLAEWRRIAEVAPADPDLIDVTPFDSARSEYGPAVAVVETRTAEFYAAAREAVPSLVSEVEALRAMLREVEWGAGFYFPTDPDDVDILDAIESESPLIPSCHFCDNNKDEGHAPDCRLDAALRQ